MILDNYVRKWYKNSQWNYSEQLEQDMILHRAIIELYNSPIISKNMVFRGGTALNKLFIKPPSRYSEDIDLVQRRSEPIGETIDAIREVLSPWLGEPIRKVTQRSVKLIFKYQNIKNITDKVKIEINTTEHFQCLETITKKIIMNSDWFKGEADAVTYEIDELMATKLKALYQRRKGRDLFDMWYVAKENIVDIERLIEIFQKYVEHDGNRISQKEFLNNLAMKRDHQAFRDDMSVLLPKSLNWDFDQAYQYVIPFPIFNK